MLPGMSRAFIKEDDSNVSAEELPERPQSPHPNYVTPGGLVALQAQLAELQEQRRQLLEPVERDIRYFQERIERAVVIDPANQPRDKVSFGALAATVDEDGTERRFAIVGEDEADPAVGKISWVSPLARALTGAAVGDSVVWKRPAGDKTLEVTAIDY